MKNPGLGYLFTGLFALVGLCTGVLFFSQLYSHYKIINNGIETSGTVVEIMYKTSKGTPLAAPVIEYKTVTGSTELYYSEMYTNIIKYEEGETVKLHYDPNNPQKVVLEKGGWMNIFLYLPFFLVFGTFGFWGLWWVDWHRRRDNWLNENGQEIQASFVGTKQSMGQHRALCEWKDPVTGQLYQFVGDWNTGIQANTIPPGTLIPVLIDADNPQRRYRLDVSHWSP